MSVDAAGRGWKPREAIRSGPRQREGLVEPIPGSAVALRWNLRRLRRIHARHRVRNRKNPASPSGGGVGSTTTALREGRPRSRARRFHAGGVPALGLHARERFDSCCSPTSRSTCPERARRHSRALPALPQERGARHFHHTPGSGFRWTPRMSGSWTSKGWMPPRFGRPARRAPISFPLPRFAAGSFPTTSSSGSEKGSGTLAATESSRRRRERRAPFRAEPEGLRDRRRMTAAGWRCSRASGPRRSSSWMRGEPRPRGEKPEMPG